MMKIYTYFSLPGLIIHELMHILFGLISGRVFSMSESYTVWRNDGAVSVGLVAKQDKMNWFQMIMVPMAPLYLIIIVAIFSFSNPIFLGILIYFIVTWIYSFPSDGDFKMIRYAKVFIKYAYYDETFMRFMRTKTDMAQDEIELEIAMDEFFEIED